MPRLIPRSLAGFRGLLAALAAGGLCLGALASDEDESRLVRETIRKQYASDWQVFCQLADAERRKVVTQATIQLASSRKLGNPFGNGPKAGALLRQDCGIADAAPIAPASLRWAVSARPLEWASGTSRLDASTSIANLGNRVFLPDGAGPFPAVVLNHTKSLSEHLLVHARELLGAGFAVLVVDSFGPRGIQPGAVVLPAELARDAYDALAHLQARPDIDSNRIFQAGYSLGAMASALLASPQGAQQLKAGGRFRATVANYGSCALTGAFGGAAENLSRIELLSTDSDRPLLMLMAEQDIETPPALCFPLLEQMKATGKDVQWHIYPRTTHAWDKAENNGFVFRTVDGQSMTYRYDAAVARDASERMVAFFNRYR